MTAEPTRPAVTVPPEGTGRGLVKVAWAGVAVQALAAAAAALVASGAKRVEAVTFGRAVEPVG